MINKNIKKLFILTLLVLLLMGVSFADESSNETKTIQETSDTTDTTNIQPSAITNDAESNLLEQDKQIKKQSVENRTTKTASQTVDVKSFNTLYNTLTSDEYTTLTLNIKSNIKLTDDTEVNSAIQKITINGNGKTISGQKKYQFLDIPSGTTVYLKNLKIINCNDDYGGSICNRGKLTITNSNFNSNKASVSGGAIYNSGTLTVKNSILHTNKAKYGGSILNYEKLWVTNSKIYSNSAVDGGAIDNEETATISNSLINNNKATNGGAIYNSGTLTITGSRFNNNRASKSGGAILENTYESDENIKIYAKFTNNSAPLGGAISINSLAKNIRINSNFTKNHASYGGAIYNNYTNNVKIVGTFNYNYANNKYNLVYNKGTNCKVSVTPLKYKFSKYGGAIFNKGNNVVINIKSAQKTTIEKLKTKITLNNIASAKKGNTVTISGKFTDETGNILKNSQIKLNINGKTYTTKTDSNGKFTYKYKTSKTGTNKVTASFNGNTNYIKTSTQKTFTVSNDKMVTMYMKSPSSFWPVKYINGDPFVVHYNKVDGQYDKGAYAEIDTRASYNKPVNKIVKTVFYYKNSYGNIITKTGSRYYYDTCFRASIPSGYTPYKVDIYYRKMTQQERNSFIW